MDPDSGAKPPEGGASAVPRGEGKSSRRRKAKRNGKRRDAAPVTNSEAADSAASAGRPHSQEPNPSARKRKRRRAKSAGAQQPVQGSNAAPAARQVPVRPEGGQQPHSAKSSSSRNRRKKNRGGRGLQGRPLMPAKATPGVAKAPSPAGSGQVSSKDIRGRAGAESQAAEQRGEKFSYVNDLYAALDLGTNNCRLLIAQPTRPGQFRVVDAFSRIVRLGEGLGTSRRLSQDAMDRAVEALRICATKLANRPIRRMRLIATEACRAAENGEEFLARVIAETGLELEIIDRETEARLAVSGCSSLVGREARSVVLFDIGGGSSEIAVIRIDDSRSSRLANHITHWTSLPVGVVTLSERHGGRDVTPDVFSAMVTEVEGMLAGFDCPPLAAFRRQGAEDFHLIGTSGTVTTLAGVHLDLPRYDRRKVDGLWLSDAEVSAMQAKLLSWDFAGRAANPCIGPDRADLVLAGCAILEAIRRRWPSQRMRVADRGLREGLLTDMMADDGVWRRVRPRRQAGGQGAGGQDEAGARR
ncbi:exopolyphosphatase/guanosine-5'-triphosphate,3'-diphosphate pyrophosphatase [Neorhizobium galegae]|uniref:Ppx/GppA phosphatase family protein n=1 Tax=Neorhizobium galegae TaxID=399 RepID=UPI00277EB47C|nr:Ppx/GppA phosphatase family protein [Neorhizobium galegae]MDQ0132912.1 exopolyphosphatase/guanosine-5'-triphosphate,3'-diphosphate pyrophosphatase [Neorhizobium galegae]